MSSNLIVALHQEERSIVAELRASRLFQRLEGVRKLLSLYDEQPSVSIGIEGLGEAERAPAAAAAGTAPLRMVPPAMSMPAAPASQPIPMPGPTAASAEAVSHAAVAAPSAEAPAESASVVSSVRAALLGIGKP